MSESLFRMIVRGRYAGMSEEGKKESLLGACKIGPEGLGGFEAKRLLADGVDFPDKGFFHFGRPLPGDIPGFELLPRVTES
jgi:hypothetical protein